MNPSPSLTREQMFSRDCCYHPNKPSHRGLVVWCLLACLWHFRAGRLALGFLVDFLAGHALWDVRFLGLLLLGRQVVPLLFLLGHIAKGLPQRDAVRFHANLEKLLVQIGQALRGGGFGRLVHFLGLIADAVHVGKHGIELALAWFVLREERLKELRPDRILQDLANALDTTLFFLLVQGVQIVGVGVVLTFAVAAHLACLLLVVLRKTVPILYKASKFEDLCGF